MGRQPVRQVRSSRQTNKKDMANEQPVKKMESSMVLRRKRVHSPSNPVAIAPKPKRTALGDVTNQVGRRQKLAPGKALKSGTTKEEVEVQKLAPDKTLKSGMTKEAVEVPVVRGQEEDLKLPVSSGTGVAPDVTKATPVTMVQQSLEATKLNDSLVAVATATEDKAGGKMWRDIDAEEMADPLFSAQYAPEIYQYMRRRETEFQLEAYMSRQDDITPTMRAILIDWLIEVQENFELFHETLYLAVQLTDHYLAVSQVQREYLQLVGATAMLIAAKFEELTPPMVEDFLYLCDDAYTRADILDMERSILRKLNYDLNMPVAYRFLRRLARAADATMETHTLARYISESTLQDYSFITDKPSYIAAGAMYLALRMKKLGPWSPTLEHYSGYSVAELLPLVCRLNQLIQSPLGQTATVRSKYSHEVFFKVATLPPLPDVEEDSREGAMS